MATMFKSATDFWGEEDYREPEAPKSRSVVWSEPAWDSPAMNLPFYDPNATQTRRVGRDPWAERILAQTLGTRTR